MNLWIAIPSLIGLAALVVSVINTWGENHLQKRELLKRVGMLFGCGIGIFLLGWLSCWLGTNHYSNIQPNADATNKAENAQAENRKIAHKYLTSPMPSQIYDAIQKLRPAQRAEQLAAQIGEYYSWKLSLFGAHPLFNGETVLTFVDGMRIGPYVNCRVDLSKYPFLNKANDGDEFIVSGKVSDITGEVFVMADATVSEPEQFSQPNSEKHTQVPAFPLPKEMTMEKIFETIDAAEPLQKDKTKERFIGGTINWNMFFFDGRTEGDNARVFLHATNPATSVETVECVVSLSDAPFLALSKVGDRIGVEGVITRINDKLRIIFLENAKVTAQVM